VVERIERWIEIRSDLAVKRAAALAAEKLSMR